MGAKNGTWVPRYQSFDDHAKTGRLVAALVALKVPECFAADVAFGQWARLGFWLLNNGATGALGAMTPRSFAHVVRWDDLRSANGLWDAWMQSGFIDHPNTPEACLHDFRDAFGHLLGARERAVRRREEFANRSRTVREQSAKSSPSHAGACAGARSRASGPVRTNNPPTPCADAALDGPDRLGGGAQQPEQPGKLSAEPERADDPHSAQDERRGAPTVPAAVVDAWNAGRAKRGLGPIRDPSELTEAARVLALAAPNDTATQAELAEAYLGLDDDWLRERGWRPAFLHLRVDGLLSARTARRPTTAVPPAEARILPTVPGATADELRPYARSASQPFTAAEEERIGAEIAARRTERPAATERWRPSPALAGADTGECGGSHA